MIEGTSSIKYSYNHGKIASTPLNAAKNPYGSLLQIPHLISETEIRIQDLKKELDVMLDITTETWSKENDLTSLKIEFARLDRNINQSLKENSSKLITNDKNNNDLSKSNSVRGI